MSFSRSHPDIDLLKSRTCSFRLSLTECSRCCRSAVSLACLAASIAASAAAGSIGSETAISGVG